MKAALVEEVPLECYQRRKPGRFKHLKVMARSEVFPASVIAYRAGRLDKALLRSFREGMLDAETTPIGRQLLTLWQLTGFAPVPADYQATLNDIIKHYPGPAGECSQVLQAVGDEQGRDAP